MNKAIGKIREHLCCCRSSGYGCRRYSSAWKTSKNCSAPAVPSARAELFQGEPMIFQLLEEVSKRFGKEKMAVCISSTEEFTANQALIESFADEVLALDTIQDEIHACSSIKIILHTEVSKTAALKSLLQKDSVYALSGAYISSLDISLQDFKADCKADGNSCCYLRECHCMG